MDRRTQERLAKIGRAIPKSLMKRGLVREESIGAFERRVLSEMLSDPKTPLAERRRIRLALREGERYTRDGNNVAEKVVETEDPKVAAEIDRLVGAKVQREIRSGRIPKPDKEKDPFWRMIRSKRR